MNSNVTLTFLTVVVSVSMLSASVLLAVIFYVLRQKKAKLSKSTAMVRPNALPMLSSKTLLQLKQNDYYDRLYSDSEDSGAVVNLWPGQQQFNEQTDHSMDDLSDYDYPNRRSSSLLSSSSGDGWLFSSREETDTNDQLNTPSSSLSNSPVMGSPVCVLNLSLKYNFHQGSLAVIVVNTSSPPKQYSFSKGLFFVIQLFQTKQNGETEDVDPVYKTGIKPYSSNVLFNEEFKYEGIERDKLDSISMRLSLCSHDRFSRVQTLGDFIVNLNEVTLNPVKAVLVQRHMRREIPAEAIEEKDKGELSLSLRYQRGSGRINVIVLKASNLKKPKKFMSNDTYITIKLLYKDQVTSKKKTKVRKGSSNPCWNEPFVFDLEEKDADDYQLLFALKGRDIFSSSTMVGTVRIGPRASLTGKTHWNDSVCSKNNTMRQVTMTHKLS